MCACTEGLSKYIKDDITSTHPGMEGKWLYRWPTKAAREAFKTILGGSGNFSKHSDSEEVLFNFFFFNYVVSLENPTRLFPIDHARRSNFYPSSHSLKYYLNIALFLSFSVVVWGMR